VKAWLLLLVCACEQKPKQPPPPAPVPIVIADAQPEEEPEQQCVRRYKTIVRACTGVESHAYTSEVEVCDTCLDDASFTWKPGGKCLTVGDSMCGPPAHRICKYPMPACGNQICPEPHYGAPP
jgi:hypothetical protein